MTGREKQEFGVNQNDVNTLNLLSFLPAYESVVKFDAIEIKNPASFFFISYFFFFFWFLIRRTSKVSLMCRWSDYLEQVSVSPSFIH